MFEIGTIGRGGHERGSAAHGNETSATVVDSRTFDKPLEASALWSEPLSAAHA